jgi:phosphopantothenoylcysteine decarboxylase/phosphopantothenate--cysteine ligase
VGPETGRLAGGDSGIGRLASPADIVAAVVRVLGPSDLVGARVVVSAGGTREPIDAVRVIANRSSGKQGYAIAAEAQARGASVTLVSTVELPSPPGVEVVYVETAADMQEAVERHAEHADVVVMAAAVADFRPKAPADGKLKKSDGVPEIILEPTPDILAGLGSRKRPGQVLVGFAAETSDLLEHAQEKLRAKRLDLVVANDVGAPGVGFGHDTNAVTILRPGGTSRAVEIADKRAIARTVVDEIVAIRTHNSTPPT